MEVYNFNSEGDPVEVSSQHSPWEVKLRLTRKQFEERSEREKCQIMYDAASNQYEKEVEDPQEIFCFKFKRGGMM